MRGSPFALLRCALVLAPLVASTACSEPSSPEPSSPTADAGVADARVSDAVVAEASVPDAGAPDARTGEGGAADASGETSATLALPSVPQTTVVLHAVPNFPAAPDRSVLLAESRLLFALGDGYPRELTGTFSSRYFAGFGQLEGKLTFERLEVPDSAAGIVTAELVAGGVHVVVSREGETKLVAHGTYVPTAEERVSEALMGLTSVPFAMHIPVSVRRVMGARFALPPGCAEPLYVATSSVLPSLSVGLVDTAGELFYPSNAQYARAAATTVETEKPFAWQTLDEDEGLESLRFPDVATRVMVRPSGGEPLVIQVVDAAAITKANVTFALAGYAGGSVDLLDGTSYPGGGPRSSNRVAPIVNDVYVGPNLLCSLPNPAWFSLTSDTQTTCDVRPLTTASIDSLVLPDFDVGLTAFVRADGECSLRLRAAGFDGGAGFERRLRVTFSKVAQLTPVE